MPDYEDLILQRQELQDIYEDEPEYFEKWDPAPKIEHKQYIDSCIVVPAWILEFEEN